MSAARANLISLADVQAEATPLCNYCGERMRYNGASEGFGCTCDGRMPLPVESVGMHDHRRIEIYPTENLRARVGQLAANLMRATWRSWWVTVTHEAACPCARPRYEPLERCACSTVLVDFSVATPQAARQVARS